MPGHLLRGRYGSPRYHDCFRQGQADTWVAWLTVPLLYPAAGQERLYSTAYPRFSLIYPQFQTNSYPVVYQISHKYAR